MTVCQLHTAVDAIVESWWLDPNSAERLIERTARKLQYHQRRNAQARASHAKTTRQKLKQAGIRIKKLQSCDFDTS